MNTVSVCIASYNPVREWLQEMLTSCAGVDEILIGDDGSVPPIDVSCYDVPDVARFEIHRRSVNAGCFPTANILARASECDFISSQADDDVFVPEALAKILEVVRHSKADVVHFPCMYFGKITGPFGVNPHPTYRENYFANNIYGASFYRKSMWEYLGGIPEIVGGDWAFWLKALKAGCRFEYVPDFGARFRVTERSWFENELRGQGRASINERVWKYIDAWQKPGALV